MRVRQELTPRVTKKNQTEYLISFWYNNKRYRFSNGDAIDLNLSPNISPLKDRQKNADVLCSAFTLAIRNGWRPSVLKEEVITICSISKRALKRARKGLLEGSQRALKGLVKGLAKVS